MGGDRRGCSDGDGGERSNGGRRRFVFWARVFPREVRSRGGERLLSLRGVRSGFWGVAAFVACRFDHCVADAFFFRLAPESPLKIAAYWGIAFVGNACGAQFLNATLKRGESADKKSKRERAEEKKAA